MFSDKNLVLTNDPENVKDEFAFDNPGFKPNEGGNLPTGAIPRPTGWPKQNAFGSEKAPQNTEGRTFLDDTFPEVITLSSIFLAYPGKGYFIKLLFFTF